MMEGGRDRVFGAEENFRLLSGKRGEGRCSPETISALALVGGHFIGLWLSRWYASRCTG